jgi:hypothetical protein
VSSGASVSIPLLECAIVGHDLAAVGSHLSVAAPREVGILTGVR